MGEKNENEEKERERSANDEIARAERVFQDPHMSWVQ